jgi:hypothetical protein
MDATEVVVKVGEDKKIYDFQKPLLLTVITIDRTSLEFRIGVLLCFRRTYASNPSADDFRLSLLWQSKTKSLTEATELFGLTLAIALAFGEKRDEKFDDFEYFSSNCCRIENHVRKIRLGWRRVCDIHCTLQ